MLPVTRFSWRASPHRDNSQISLTEFPVLKRDRLRAPNLLGEVSIPLVTRLPSSIESLSITDGIEIDQRDIFDPLKDVIAVAGARFPRLARLRIEDPLDEDDRKKYLDDVGFEIEPHDFEMESKAIMNLKRVSEEAGIEFSFAKWEHGLWNEYHGSSIDCWFHS